MSDVTDLRRRGRLMETAALLYLVIMAVIGVLYAAYVHFLGAS